MAQNKAGCQSVPIQLDVASAAVRLLLGIIRIRRLERYAWSIKRVHRNGWSIRRHHKERRPEIVIMYNISSPIPVFWKNGTRT